MPTPGIFITQVGASVPTAADYQFVYNSNWPSLACAYDKLITVGAGATVTLPLTLGFTPLMLAWINVGGINKGRIFAPSGNFEYGDSYAHAPQTAITMTWNKTGITLTNNDGANAYDVCVKGYNLDITKAVDYTLPKYPAATQPYDSSVGIKVTKFGKGITSTDLRDFVLHSRAQSPALLSIITGTSANGVIYYNNPANYTPWTLAFYDDSNGNYQGLAPGSQQSGVIFQLGSALVVAGRASTINGSLMNSIITTVNMSLVVLRDPLILAKAVEVQY